MADLSKLRFNGTDYNVKDASAPTRKFTNTYSKTGNLPITSDDTTQTAIGKLENNIIPKSAKGTANGVAELDANGKVPSSQLPSYVDDVLEYSAKSSFPATGESGKIYVDTTTNKTYRWSGSAYVEISESLALGETDSTAYRGDRGKTAYNHSQLTSGNPHNVTKSDVGLGNVGNFKAVSTAASQGLSDTEKSNARANIGAGTGNGTYSKPSGGIPKSDLASAVQTSLDQVNTNKTNILYALGKTGRNQFNIDMTTLKYWNTAGTWNGNVYTQGGLTFTFNNDGTIDVSGTATERVNIVLDVYYPLNTESGYRFHDLDGLVLSGCPTGGAWNKYSLSLQMTDSPWASAAQDTGSGAIIDKSVLPSNVTTVAFYLSIYASYPTSSLTFKPMFCTQEDWSITHDYTSYQGAPNYDLTRLESEDRAGLVECVDGGAKNKLQNKATSKTENNVTFTVNSDGEVTVSTTAQGASANTSISLTGAYIPNTFVGNILSGLPSGSTSDKCILIAYSNNGSSETKAYYLNAVSAPIHEIQNYPYFQLFIWFKSGQIQTTPLKYQPMICTKAAFGVSKAFVPYRPNYDLVSYLANAGGFHDASHGSFVQNADLNAISESCVRLYHSPSNNPTTATYVLVKTYMLDSTTGMQEATAFASPVKSYTRVKMASTWGSWVETTNA